MYLERVLNILHLDRCLMFLVSIVLFYSYERYMLSHMGKLHR
jgi:hypothetical protein